MNANHCTTGARVIKYVERNRCRGLGDSENIYAATGMQPLHSDGFGRTLITALWYRPSDPFAVELYFPESGTSWVFARSLLAAGLTTPTGDGDLHIDPYELDPEHVLITLDSPNGTAVLRATTADLSTFLTASLIRVPLGMESSQQKFDLDALGDPRADGSIGEECGL